MGPLFLMESTRNPHHDISIKPLDSWVACTFSSSFAGLGPRYFWIFLMSAFFGISGHQFNLFSKSVFVAKPPKQMCHGQGLLPWGELSSQAVHLLSADLDLGSFNATTVIESETAGCIDTLTPWGLKQVMFIVVWVSLWLESCLSTWNTTNNKSLLTVYSVRLIDTRLDSHWKLSNTLTKRTKHLSKRVPPSGVNQPIVIYSSKKSIESLRAGYLAKAFKARPGHETKWNNHGFFSAFLVGFLAQNSGAKQMVKLVISSSGDPLWATTFLRLPWPEKPTNCCWGQLISRSIGVDWLVNRLQKNGISEAQSN